MFAKLASFPLVSLIAYGCGASPRMKAAPREQAAATTIEDASASSLKEARHRLQKEFSQAKAGCDANDSAACVVLGKSYEDARGTDFDIEAARAAFGRACKLRNGKGCYEQAASLILRGTDGLLPRDFGADFDPNPAFDLHIEGCRLGYRAACRWALELFTGRINVEFVARNIEHFAETPADKQQIESLLARDRDLGRIACEAGDGEECLWQTRIWPGGSNERDTFGTAANKLLQPKCENGEEPLVCLYIGLHLWEWTPEVARMPPSDVRAAYLKLEERVQEKNCDRGERDSCFTVANALALSHDEPEKAASLYQWACSLGHASACYARAMFGKVPLDADHASRLIERSCELGNRSACEEMAR